MAHAQLKWPRARVFPGTNLERPAPAKHEPIAGRLDRRADHGEIVKQIASGSQALFH
jgi:hypothetical protein